MTDKQESENKTGRTVYKTVREEEAKSTVNESTKNQKPADEEEPQDDDAEEEEEEEEIKLYKSTRLKGYLTLLLASSLNFVAAYQSNDVVLANAVPATDAQRSYALSASMVSMIFSFVAVVLHLDPWTPLRKVWIKMFRPSSCFELLFILALSIWWIIATWIQTSIEGIAGDGKGQYNLYFSTWACFITCLWTLDRWLVAKGLSSLKGFLASWPNRAPGWIAMVITAFGAFLAILDLFLNWQDASKQSDEAKIIAEQFSRINDSQWNWLLCVTALTVPPSCSFVLVELFREKKDGNAQSQLEIVVEGVFLLLAILGWIPSVIVATTPGGAASSVGNAYFFIWAGSVFVMETSIWWVHDWRKSIHEKIRLQEEEYKKIQQEVLQKSREHKKKDDEDDNRDTDIVKGSIEDKRVSFLKTREEGTVKEEDEDEADQQDYDSDGVIPDVIGT